MTTEPVRQPIPINEAEAMVDTFFDEKISALASYVLNRETAAAIPRQCNARSVQYWCWNMLKWDHAPAGIPIVTLERTMNVSIAGYDRLMVRLAAPEHVALRVSAVIDGAPRTLIAGEAGHAGPHEYEAPISGERMEGLKLELTSSRDQADEAWLYWIGVANDARRSAMLARPCPFDARWEPWLLPPEARPELTPRFGFFFDASDLPAIRRRAASPAYRPLMQQMRERARHVMAFHKSPEQQIGDYLASGPAWKIQTRERDWDTFTYHVEAPLLAFVGLVDEDTEMLRFAARIAVAVAHNRSWSAHFMQDFPGSTWDTRAFSEGKACAGVGLALDWAGCWFTDAGEHLIRYAITHKGLGRIRGTLLQYAYMWDCNQAHNSSLGRLIGLLVQLGHAGGAPSKAMAGLTPESKAGWPRASADIDQYERDVLEMIDRYVQDDGTLHEGVGYWGTAFRTTLPALAALARHRGRPLREMVPHKLNLMWSYLAPLLTTAGEPGSYLTVSDASNAVLPFDPITMAAHMLEEPGWKGLLGACLSGGKTTLLDIDKDWMFDGPFTLIYGPDEPPAPSIDVPVFHTLKMIGMITSNRPWRSSTVRLHLVGAMPNAGHCHPDKGSFILEACGEVLAGDRGLMIYDDPLCRTLSAEVAHNLAVPEDCFQINPSPAGAAWTGEGNESRLAAQINASATWLPPVRIAHRRIHSPRPDLIEITDEFELDEARPVSFYLNTPLPISARGTQAAVQGTRARLHIQASWAVSSSAGEYYCDFAYRPWNRLVMTSAPATRHLLTTILRLEPTGA